MTQEEGFLQAIIEDPDDDAVRLIYADWLEDHGRPERAEFIRVQIELSRLNEDDPRRPELELREWQLLDEHEEEWLQPLAYEEHQGSFRRGFVDYLWGDASYLLRSPHLGQLVTLNLHNNKIGLAGIKDLVSFRNLPSLQKLDLSDNCIDDTAAELLLASPLARQLTHLDLCNNNLTANRPGERGA